jgi:hypothetical protein
MVAAATWKGEFLVLIARPGVHPNLGAMGNLRGLHYAWGAPTAWWSRLVYLAPVALSVYLDWRERESRTMLGYARVAGLLTGGHAYIRDFALLLVVYSVMALKIPKEVRIAFQQMLLPFVYYGLIVGSPYNALAPAALAGLMACWAINARRAKSLI